MANVNGTEIDLMPTDGMRTEAERYREWKADGEPGGTEVAATRASQILSGDELSPETVITMAAWFARHEVDKQGEGFSPDEDGYPSPGRVAWAAWGGDAGQSWSNGKADRIKALQDRSAMEMERPYPNEHAARLTDPDQYDSLRRENGAGGPGIDFIYGIKGGESEIQAIRFSSAQYTPAEARNWLGEHDFNPIMFEEATGDGERAEPGDLSEGDFVQWDSSGGTARGRIEHVMREGTLGVPGTEFSIDATSEDPAALIRIYSEADEGWEPTEVLVGHKFSTLTKIDALRAMPGIGKYQRAELTTFDEVEDRTYEFPFSSEFPVARYFGNEILSHEANAADLSRLNDGAPVLFNHDMDDVIGVIERAWLGADSRGYALLRFARTPRGDEVMGMVADGVLRNVSFMYRVESYQIDTEEEDPYFDPDALYTATRWMAYEISIVSVPADQTVGVGRSLAAEELSVRVLRPAAQARSMSPPQAISAAGNNPKEFQMEANTQAQSGQEVRSAAGGAAAGAGANENSQAATRGERDRVQEIVALGRKHNLTMERVHDMIGRGIDIAAARGEVLEDMLKRDPGRPVASFGESYAPDLTDKEKRKYSFLRALQASSSKEWGKAGFEREVSNDIAKRTGKNTDGFFIPNDLPFAPDEEHLRAWQMMSRQGIVQHRAPYLVGTAGQGGNLVQTQLLYESFVEVLRNQLVTAILGARYLTGLTGNIDIPRQNSATATYWVAESGAPTEAEATFDKVSLRPKTVGALSKMSRLMLLQATPAIEMLARQDLLAVIALAMDLAALSGSGASNQPTGIVNQAGVGSVVGGTNGANLTFDHLIQLKYATKFANAPQGAAAFALNTKAIGYLSTLKATTGQYLWEPQGGLTAASPDRVKGSPYAESQQLRSTLTKGSASGICSENIYGNWQELFIAMWGVTEVMLNPYDSTGFTTGDVWMRAFQTCDIGVRHAASFAVMSDSLTPGF